MWLEKEGEAGGGSVGAAGNGLLHVGAWQGAEAEEKAVVDPGADIGRSAAGAGDEPAGDPGLAGGKAPVGGMNLEGVLPVGGGHGWTKGGNHSAVRQNTLMGTNEDWRTGGL